MAGARNFERMTASFLSGSFSIFPEKKTFQPGAETSLKYDLFHSSLEFVVDAANILSFISFSCFCGEKRGGGCLAYKFIYLSLGNHNF